jgi:RNA polymerase sigma factor (sigma-70 family)
LQPKDPVDDSAESALEIESLLLAYQQAADESASQSLAAQLISEYAEPVIIGALRYKLGLPAHFRSGSGSHPEAEDIISEVMLELLTRLRKLKAEPAAMAIKDFRGLAAVMTYQACARELRRRNPQRAQVKNRLRYLLTRDQEFALWKGGTEEWLCGFARWQQQSANGAGPGLRQLLDHPQQLQAPPFSKGEAGQLNPAELLTAIFNWAGAPVGFNELVRTVAGLWGIKDYPHGEGDNDGNLLSQLPDPRTDVATTVEKRLELQRIWAEICLLPERQRNALLLNLSDATGYGVIALLPVTGIASLRQIAEVLGMSAQQLAEIWKDLPLDDTTIAAHLGVTRQQVINLRKSARERLIRRMRK